MGEEVKKERADLVVLDADPVDAVALTYDSERIPVKYQKIGDARTLIEAVHRQWDTMFTRQSVERYPPKKLYISEQHHHKTRTRLVSEAIQPIQPRSKPFGMHPWRADGYRQRL